MMTVMKADSEEGRRICSNGCGCDDDAASQPASGDEDRDGDAQGKAMTTTGLTSG